MVPVLQIISAGEQDGHGLMEPRILTLLGTTGMVMNLMLMIAVDIHISLAKYGFPMTVVLPFNVILSVKRVMYLVFLWLMKFVTLLGIYIPLYLFK